MEALGINGGSNFLLCLNIAIPLFLIGVVVWLVRYFLTRGTPKQIKSPAMIESDLQRLADMRERGVIDDTEYKQLRENIINRG